MPPPDADALPPPVAFDLAGPVQAYWADRVLQHIHDRYAGVPMSKFPEDLRVYEHLIWTSGANVVIELGTQHGGSALWFRDRLQAFARYGRIRRPLVIAVDVDLAPAREAIGKVDPAAKGITLVEGDVRDPALPDAVRRHVPRTAACLVVEDTSHTYETTMASLQGFAEFVRPGGFLVVEDGCVDVPELRLADEWPRGVLHALNDWLTSPAGQDFAIRRDLEIYGVTSHPYGFLQRSDTRAAAGNEVRRARRDTA